MHPAADARSLALLAAGTKHTVWRICEADGSPSGRILRIPKHTGSETPAEGESSFVQLVLAPLLGSQFVHPSLARLSFPERLIREFHDAAQRGEGVTAAEASEAIAAADAAIGGACTPPGTEVLVETDHTVLRLCAANEPCASTAAAAAAPACTPALCVELKPKAGVLASGALGEAAWSRCRPWWSHSSLSWPPGAIPGAGVPPDRPGASYSPRAVGATGEARPGCCRFCLHVRSKTVGAAPTEYCPLDLYSAEAPRMSRALRALLSTPLNNLRVFSREGACAYGGRAGLGSRGLLRRALLRELSVAGLSGTAWPAAGRRVAAASAPSGGGHGVEGGEEGGEGEGGEEEGGEEEGERAEALLVDVVVRVLLREPLLGRLRAVHARDVRGSGAAAEAHSRALAALGAEALAARLARWPPCADGAAGQEAETGGAGAAVAVAVAAGAPAGAVAEGSEGANERAAAGGAVRAPADGATQAADEVAQLRAWLTALTAADLSLMLALRRAPAEDGRPSHVQPCHGLSPGRVHAAGGEAFLYRLAVVDVQPKPLSKVAAHAELDRRIAQMPPLARMCTERDGECLGDR